MPPLQLNTKLFLRAATLLAFSLFSAGFAAPAPDIGTTMSTSPTTSHPEMVLQLIRDRPVEMRFSPDERILATLFNKDALEWDTETGDLLRNVPLGLNELKGPAQFRASEVFSPDQLLIASNPVQEVVQVRSFPSGKLLRTLAECGPPLKFSPDNRTLATVSLPVPQIGKPRSTVKLWDARTGALLHALPEILGGVDHLVFSPDGRKLAVASVHLSSNRGPDTVIILTDIGVWDVGSGRRQSQLPPLDIALERLTLSPDGSTLTTLQRAGDWGKFLETQQWMMTVPPETLSIPTPHPLKVQQWDVRTGGLLHTVQSSTVAESAQLLGDNRTVAFLRGLGTYRVTPTSIAEG
ncbi:MAG: hypothetical protein M3Y56_03260, partial [Armatimonadota bacterium]|nr:hypothetical protein [Armatimonadota bacterium]